MTNSVLVLSIFVTIFCATGCVVSTIAGRGSRSTAGRALKIMHGHELPERNRAFWKGLKGVALSLLGSLRSRFGGRENEKLRAAFARAGVRSSGARDIFFAARVLGPILSIIVVTFLPGQKIYWLLALGGLSYLAPSIILERLGKRRSEKIRLGVPDAIDLLVICVDAGLGLDQALMRVGEELSESHPEIHVEFAQINWEQRAGSLRLDAWRSMANRTQVTEVNGFVDMLMQTERFGTPIARALSSFGDGLRQKRRQRAEELAAKTTVKIIFPLVLCIFPSLFIVLLGPAGITIARTMAESTF